jgi:chorismate mutase
MTERDPWAEIHRIRKSIDNVDSALIHILAERFKLTRAVGALKAEFEIPASTPDREKQQIARLRKLALDSELDPDFAEAFITFLIENVIRNHLKMRD